MSGDSHWRLTLLVAKLTQSFGQLPSKSGFTVVIHAGYDNEHAVHRLES